MTPQGYPLWAVREDGAAFAVIGWDESGYPLVVSLAGRGEGWRYLECSEVFTFTTTDPTDPRGRVKASYSCPCGGDCDTGALVTRRETTVCINGTHGYENGGWQCTYAGPRGCSELAK